MESILISNTPAIEILIEVKNGKNNTFTSLNKKFNHKTTYYNLKLLNSIGWVEQFKQKDKRIIFYRITDTGNKALEQFDIILS